MSIHGPGHHLLGFLAARAQSRRQRKRARRDEVPAPSGPWIIVCPADNDGVIACADCGATPLFETFDHALAVAHANHLPGPQPRRVPDVSRLECPEPYHAGMTFDAARVEMRAMSNQRRRRQLLRDVW